jgi:hypothetical protein
MKNPLECLHKTLKIITIDDIPIRKFPTNFCKVVCWNCGMVAHIPLTKIQEALLPKVSLHDAILKFDKPPKVKKKSPVKRKVK